MKTKNAWLAYDEQQAADAMAFAEQYRTFISENKTERECVAAAVKRAEAAGYVSLEKARTSLERPDKVYAHAYGKTLMLIHRGKRPLEEGVNILGAHIDSPRLDIKQNPLYENKGLALLDTHYYGGIKKYQWVTLPLAIHGVIAKPDGTVEHVNVGEDAGDPVFCVTDLLIHLAGEQMKKTGAQVVDGEDLDVLVGSRPQKVDDDDAEESDDAKADDENDLDKLAKSEPVKATCLRLLADKYGMEEADFLSSELEVVPAGAARDMGFDSSMILGYGQDDRVCAFPSLIAQLELEEQPERTAVCILTDKEEIGSVGATGMASLFFENTMAEVIDLFEGADANGLTLRRCLANSNMLSSDVSAGFDPTYAPAFEEKNAAFMGHGVVFNKFTGSRGKSGSNDANAEYMAKIRAVMAKGGVTFQTAELGKVDVGGGGTIAFILAKYGMNVIDCGVPVLSMHAPWEVTDKADIYEALKAYRAFLKFA
jgi:aspartyl aminopeptidase